MLDLRFARITDSDLLFAWRNDQATRAGSTSTAEISREDHDRWMQFNVLQGYPEHLVMLADTEFGSVGVIRFDADRRDLMTYKASITVAPQWRRKGWGVGILSEGCRFMKDFALLAEIRSDNEASRKMFERCGFVAIGADYGLIKYRKEPSP